MSQFQEKRLIFEDQNLQENADKLPANCTYQKVGKFQYVVQYVGLPNTPHAGAYIVVDVDVTTFPAEAPNIQFRNGFQHVNVWPTGKLCIYLSTFSAGTTLLEIFTDINQVIHYPSFIDPANATILISDNGKDYDQKMLDQAKRLSQPQYRAI